MDNFRTRLIELRRAAGFTQEQLADLAGMYKNSVSKLEQGEREPSWETIQALAQALGVTCQAFQEKAGRVSEPKRGRPAKAPAPKRRKKSK